MALRHVKVVKKNETDGYPCIYSSCVPPVSSIFDPPSDEKEVSSSHHLSLKVIIIVTIIGATLLLGTYYVFIMKFWSRWNMLRRARAQNNNAPLEVDDESDEDEVDQNPIHHVWYITTVGLEESVINSISVCKYKMGDGLIEETDCSVCLSEFCDGENVRLLPKCSHAFHLPCIDTWLRSHVNCPLCRAPIVSISGTSSSNSDPLDTMGETQMRNSEVDPVLERNQSTRVESNRREEGPELDSGDKIGGDIGREKEVPFPPANFGFRVQSDLTDNHRSGERAIQLTDIELQPFGRSISMNSLSASLMSIQPSHHPTDSEGSSSAIASHSRGDERFSLLDLPRMKKFTPNRNQAVSKMVGKGAFLQKEPVSMKRSFSTSGKYRNSILPL